MARPECRNYGNEPCPLHNLYCEAPDCFIPSPKGREEREEAEKPISALIREIRERTEGWSYYQLTQEVARFYQAYLHEKAYREQYQRGLRTHSPEAVEKDDEGRPYPCGAFVSGDSRWFCRLESDHEGDHEWLQRHSPEEPVWPEPGAPAPAKRPPLGRVREMPGWRPIETAPKDGTWVILYAPEGGVQPAYWGPTYFGYSPAWIQYRHRSEAEEIAGEPTHWMPLPEPPISQPLDGEPSDD